MKSSYVSDLQANQVITTTLLVQVKEVRQKKTGEPYLSLVLCDRTGELEAKMWDNVTEVLDTFEREDFIKVKGLLQVYQNRLQLTIHKMVKVRESEIDFADYFPCSDRSPEEMFADLKTVIAGVRDPHLRALLEAFSADEPLMKQYRTAPAAKNVHHAFLGGLLEHVLSLCWLCNTIGPHYRDIDLDLVLTGAILHDIGKVAELTYERSFGYSAEGQLLGHIVIAIRMLNDKIAKVADFPPKLRTLLEHLIVSHHGELEFGSPKTPLFPEAMLLHHLDNLDSKMDCMRSMIAKDRQVAGCWTTYSPALDRSVLKRSKYLNPDPPPAVEPLPALAGAPAPPMASPQQVQKPVNGPSPNNKSLFAEKLAQAWHK